MSKELSREDTRQLLKRKERISHEADSSSVDSALENNVSFGFIFLFERDSFLYVFPRLDQGTKPSRPPKKENNKELIFA